MLDCMPWVRQNYKGRVVVGVTNFYKAVFFVTVAYGVIFSYLIVDVNGLDNVATFSPLNSKRVP